MGFDNECIVNIQSLAGEYFCPVCRTLVYPNEALQSQCTHLYCKPCLTYVVGTTKACPYDGYLVTEKDSKPLVESDKALADRIGKTLVLCLFHRSGCSWQGPLSECTSHCSGCSFGNSPVVCNRCGIQIIHRQVQEHAQNCAGANPHVQQIADNTKDAATAVTVTTANSIQTSSQPLVHTSQAPQMTTAPPTTQDSNPHVQAIASGAGITADQWYPQHFQQYYQQYPGYEQYPQYYPYQQQTAQQVQQNAPHVGQPQVYAQPQIAMQGQPLPQVQGQGQGPQPQPQGQPQAQSFVQNQVNPQQQSHLVTQPHPQIQVHTQSTAQGQIPQQQPYPQAQPYLLPHSMQPPAQQNFQPHSTPQPVLQSQPQSHPHLHPLQPNNPQSQQPAPHVVTGYQQQAPIQSHQQILQAPSQQYPMHMHPSSGSFPPAAQFPQQSPHMRPPQTNASLPNQQQPNQMPSKSQTPGVPPAQHPQIHPQTPQQGYIGHQHPTVQPMQQPLQQYGQQPFPSQAYGSVQGPLHQIPFGQQPMQTQSQPQGPTQLQQSAVALPPPPQHGSVQAHGMPPQHPQAYGGRPVAPNQAATSQPFPQSGGAFGVAFHSRPLPSSSVQPSGHQIFVGGTGNQQQVPSGQQFSQSDRAIKHTLGEGNAAAQVGPAINKIAGNDVSGPGVDPVRGKALESEIGGKSGDEEHKITGEDENHGTHKGTSSKVAEAEVDALKVGSSEPSMKKIVKEEDANCNLDPSSGGSKVETAILNERDGSVFASKQIEYSSVKDSTSRQTEAYVGHKKDDTNVMAHENKLSREQVNPQGPAVNEYARFQDKGLMDSSNPAPLTDQGRYQMPLGPYGPSSQQQRPATPSHSQSGSYLGAPPNALPGQGPANLRPQGPGLSVPLHQSLYPSDRFHQSSSSHTHESFEGVPRGQYYQNNPHSQPVFSKTLNALANENRAPGFEAASGLHVKNVNDDHRNQFMSGPAGRIGQSEYEQAPKQFPKPSLLGVEPPANFGNGFSSRAGDHPHEYNFNTPSKFLPSYHPSGTFHASNVGERPTGFHDDRRARGDSSRTKPDFHGSGPGFGADHLPPRSPGREYHGIQSRVFGGQSGGPHNQSGLDDVHGQGTHAVHEGPRSFGMSSDPVGKSLRDHFRNGDLVGQDFIPNHMRRGELFGPRNVPNHLHAGDGFGKFPDPRMGELTGHGGFPHAESFVGNKSNHPRLGEPGFRSSFSLHGFPSDGGFYVGNSDAFDRFRKRMPTSMGWCRICTVDCDTVDGLDLHSQTTEHQQRTMDMVISIKQQNAKRQKTAKDHSSVEEGIRSRNAGNRGRGKKA